MTICTSIFYISPIRKHVGARKKWEVGQCDMLSIYDLFTVILLDIKFIDVKNISIVKCNLFSH